MGHWSLQAAVRNMYNSFQFSDKMTAVKFPVFRPPAGIRRGSRKPTDAPAGRQTGGNDERG